MTRFARWIPNRGFPLLQYIAKVISSNRKPAKISIQLTRINCSPSLCVGSVYRVLWVLAGTSVAGRLLSHAACFYKSRNYWFRFKFFIVKEIIEKNVSPELDRFMKENEITSVDALLSIENEDLLQMEGFGWRMMKEVLSLRKIQ